MSSQRISNRLILTGLIVGLLYQIGAQGISGIGIFIVHIAIPVILLFLLFLMRALGAGDIKLFSMISSIYSYKALVCCMAAAFCVGAVMALVKMLYRKDLWLRFVHLAVYVREMYVLKQFKPYVSDVKNSGDTIHFSIAVLLGYLVSLGVCH